MTDPLERNKQNVMAFCDLMFNQFRGGASGVLLGVGLGLSCSRAPSLYITGAISPAGPAGMVGCSLELLDRNAPRRSAGVIRVRAREPFSVLFTEQQDRIISDDSTAGRRRVVRRVHAGPASGLARAPP